MRKIGEVEKKPNKRIISELETMLAQAQKGEIQVIMVAGTQNGESDFQFICGMTTNQEMLKFIGICETMKMQIMSELLEDAEEL